MRRRKRAAGRAKLGAALGTWGVGTEVSGQRDETKEGRGGDGGKESRQARVKSASRRVGRN